MRLSQKKYETELVKVSRFLQGDPKTAKDIAKKFRIRVPAAYARVRALEERGYSFYTFKIADKKRTGPASVAWLLYGVR